MAKGYTLNLSEKLNIVPWEYVIEALNGQKIVETFYKKLLQEANQTEFRVEKVIKKKYGKSYVK